MTEVCTIDLSILGENLRTIEVPARSVIFLKGDQGSCAYAIRAGEVALRGAGRALETLGPGCVFGEMAVIDGGARSASAVALDDAQLVAIPRAEFMGLLAGSSDFSLQVMQMLVARLRAADDRVLDEDDPNLAAQRA